VVTPATGAVILVPFPFSDLSQAKLRPAVVLAEGIGFCAKSPATRMGMFVRLNSQRLVLLQARCAQRVMLDLASCSPRIVI
jgi:hypothetical protein